MDDKEEKNQYSNYVNIQDMLNMDGLTDITISDTDDSYIISGIIDMNKVSQMDTSLLDSVGMDMNIKCDLSMVINKETYLPASMTLDFTKQKLADMEIQKGLFVIKYNGYTANDGSLVVPDDVIDNSIEAGDAYNVNNF